MSRLRAPQFFGRHAAKRKVYSGPPPGVASPLGLRCPGKCDKGAVFEASCCGHHDEHGHCCGEPQWSLGACGVCGGINPEEQTVSEIKKRSGDLPTAIEAKWAAAAAFPGESIDMGDLVACDLCGRNFTGRSDGGGLVFESKAVCPACAPSFMAGVEKYGEQEFIRATCPQGESFWQFVLGYRRARGQNSIKVLTADAVARAMGLSRKEEP